MKLKALFSLALVLIFTHCSKRLDDRFIGSAAVEVKTYQVSATVLGQLLTVLKDEGDKTAAGELVAVIDTIPLLLKVEELNAMINEANQQIAAKKADITAGQTDVKGLKREFDRTSDLVAKGSVPSQQKDILETQYTSAQQKLNAAVVMLNTFTARIGTLQAQINELKDNIRRCYIKSPCSGIIQTRYRNTGEMAGPASPIFEIGSIDTVQVDFFVSQPLLSKITYGQKVSIRLDDPEDSKKGQLVPAVVKWISDQAEFSPKNIQTRDARNELVFRVRAKAVNKDKILKRGLPVEVWF
jgi:HlyD family secretion protein